MSTILAYKIIKKIYESSNSLVYRGFRIADRQPVVLKMLKQSYPPPDKIAWFKQEYETTKNLKLDGVVKVYSLENDQNCWVMVLEDFGGESLEQLMLNQRFSLDEFFTIANQVVDILGQIHRQKIIHKDINPSNIVFNLTTGQLKLIDFGIATVLPRENPTVQNPNQLEGTLAYISPEQTGRMNRGMDYRTDFYSLGTTFYKLLTGQVPFETTDAMGLVHAHIAQKPTPPHEIKPEIPQQLSEIVMKLMAKNAEDRYQSARGLKVDLEKCHRQWQQQRQIDPFPLGEQDFSDELRISQRLYGREEEIKILLASFARVCQGASEMLLVSGYAGIGKSVLVQEVYKPIAQQQAYFIVGKFEQYQRDIPYASLLQAFRSLVRQLLAEGETQIAFWRKQLLTSLGNNSQIIIDLIPEVELIIGSQPAVAELSSMEAQNRFHLVFQNFIKAFPQPEHPLVLFLDDLQWADSASLKIIQYLTTDSHSKYLYIIGAYRDNEVKVAHPLKLTLDEIHKAQGIVNYVTLKPLDGTHVLQLISNTFNVTSKTAKPLADLVFQKTDGNPFFINEFLKLLYSENLIRFDFQCGSWQWNLEQIQVRGFTDNVVEFMAHKIQKLSEVTQKVLKLAACIGNHYDIQTLATVYEKSPQETSLDLWPAIAIGLILPLGETYKLIEHDVQGLSEVAIAEYKFAHDRIQQAVYSLIPDTERQALHLRIGRLLLENTLQDKLETKIFAVVNHLNLGRQLIHQSEERERLAQLNFKIGKKAKDTAAYQSAFNYFLIGLNLLQKNCWQYQYKLALSLHLEAAEAAFLIRDFSQMEQLLEVVLQQAKTLLDKVKVYVLQIQASIAKNQLLPAIDIAFPILEMMGIVFPKQASQQDIEEGLEEIQSALAERKIEEIEDLINLPEMKDPEKVAIMELIFDLTHPFYVTSPQLFTLAVLKMVSLSIQYGNTYISIRGYALYAMALCGVLRNFDTGYQVGQLTLKLIDKLNAKHLKPSTFFFINCFVRHWKKHIKEMLNPLLEGFNMALEIGGELQFAAWGIHSYCYLAYYAGKELKELEQEMTKASDCINQFKQKNVLDRHLTYRQAVLNLVGNGQNTCYLIGEDYHESTMKQLYLENNDRNALCELYIQKLILSYLFYEYSQALENSLIAEEYIENTVGTFNYVIFNFYESLCKLAIYHEKSPIEQQKILEKVEANQKTMRHWANNAPMNHLHKFYLVEAEYARVLGRDSETREYYDRAITLAHENEYINEEALAYELAGKFYLAKGQKHTTRYYLQDAYYAYQRWGAVAKIKDLEARYPQYLANISTDSPPTLLNISATESSKTTSDALDLNSVLQASQALTSEIVLEKLLQKLMKILIENAGAQKGYLLLDREGRWVIEAEGTVNSDGVTTLQSVPVNSLLIDNQIPTLSNAIVNYVARTQENVVLNDASQEGQFTRDRYVVATQPKSILCTPLLYQGKLSGILYLENNLTTGAFTPERVEVLKILSTQAAISIENSRLYERLEDYSRTLEQKVEDRTQELQEKNQELASLLEKLKATQAQIIAQEKLASLGALTAGIAHEIKNPLNFVNNFAELSIELTQELLEELEKHKDQLDLDSKEYIEGILSDLSQNAQKINEHGKRADNIVRGMLMHSRGQTCDERQMTHVNTLLAEAISLVYHGMRAKDSSFHLDVATHYDNNIGQLDIVPQNISRAFINIINNAGYAAYKKAKRFQAQPESEREAFSPTLTVKTQDLGNLIEITIRDNGDGIPQEMQDKIFHPFFTTKPPGEGTGLGLSIAHDIIVQQHQGEIKVESEVNNFTDFIVTLPKNCSSNRLVK